MTASSAARASAAGAARTRADVWAELVGCWTGGRRVERVGYLVGALLLASGLVHLGVQVVLGGPWNGPVSWRKPTTFGLSFGLTVISVTWVASFLRPAGRTRAVLLGGFLAASVAEVSLITAQAWRRVPSHFNFETPTDTRITAVLAVGGGVLFVALGGLTGLALRRQPQLDPTMRLAVRLGFGSLMAALVVGAIMIGVGTALVRAGQPRAAYHDPGVFKLAHAVAMHGIALLPGVAWLSCFAAITVGRRHRLLLITSAAYAALLAAALVVGPVSRA